MIKYVIKHKNYGYCSIGANWKNETYCLDKGFIHNNMFLADSETEAESVLSTLLNSIWNNREDFTIVKIEITEL